MNRVARSRRASGFLDLVVLFILLYLGGPLPASAQIPQQPASKDSHVELKDFDKFLGEHPAVLPDLKRDLDVPIPTIDVAVAIQMLTSLEEGRAALRRMIGRRPIYCVGKPDFLIDQMKRALCAGMIVTFAQGLALLKAASEVYGYDLALDEVARIWRGSIIRSPMLQDIQDAFYVEPPLPHLLSHSIFAHQLRTRRADLRAVVRLAIEMGIPAPALTASLSYFDAPRMTSSDDLGSAHSTSDLLPRQHEGEQTKEELRLARPIGR